jgi:hypothetical protein
MKRLRVAVLAATAATATAGAVPGEALAASESCTAPTVTAVDGWLNTMFLRLTAQRSPDDPRTTWICYRVGEDGSRGTGDRGGRIDVTDATISPTLPSVDGDSGSCTATTPNLLPGPRPLLGGQIGDPEEPPSVPFLVDAYLAPSQFWTCLKVGGVDARLKIATTGISPPAVSLAEDAHGLPVPPTRPGPAGYPSSHCMEAPRSTRVANISVGDAHVWAHLIREIPNRIVACLRVERPGQQPIGYRIDADAGGAPGVTPVIGSSTDTTPCTITVAEILQPIHVRLTRSPAGSNPASLCVAVGTLTQRLTIGTTGAVDAPEVGLVKDPDSA